MNNIPILDLGTEVDLLWDELNNAIQRVLRSTNFIMGEEVTLLEYELASYLGVRHAVGVNSGTDALVIALRALGIQAGDEVITSSFTFFATAEAISILGAAPIFVDIDPQTFNLDVNLIEAAITERTKAILPVHLFGQGNQIDQIMKLATRYNLKVVEDTAQAFGGRYKENLLGTIGNIGTYSFFPTKNLGAFGDAGLIVTNDADINEQMRMLRTHGSKKKYFNELLGYNSRLDTIQAAILRVKLPYVEVWNKARRDSAQRYNHLLADLPDIITPFEDTQSYHVYHQYTIRVLNGRRNMVQKALAASGIGTMIYYPVPVHKLPIYAHQNFPSLPETERAAEELLSLPIGPYLKVDTQQYIASTLKQILQGKIHLTTEQTFL
jgi:dTDP-4-amino-4,6-dideoxygalactose transaminase